MYDVIAHGLGYAVSVHSSCECNELVSLHNRHLVDQTDIPFDKDLWLTISAETLKYYPRNLDTWSLDEVVAEYSGSKRRIYERAKVSLKLFGLESRHAIINMFVKPDRYPTGDCPNKDPRAIQFRRPQFNLAFSCYIKPYEKALYSTLHMGTVSRTRVIAKGLNNVQRAELLLHKIDHFVRPCFILIDHSRFDSTINTTHLRTTHKRYFRAFKSGTLARLLKEQKQATGYTKSGIKYKVTGTRMSGDADTGCGNSMINADCIYGFLLLCGIKKYDYILDGDDAVIVIEKKDLPRADPQWFGKLGFRTKYSVAHDLADVEFCQSKLILTDPPTFSRNPARAISHASVMRRRIANKTIPEWIAGVGECERSTNLGVPILQAFGTQLAAMSPKRYFDPDLAYRLQNVELNKKNRPITADARETFSLAWGVPIDLQELLERHDYTAVSYASGIKAKNVELGTIAKIRAAEQSAPEFSSCCWWSSSQVRDQRPGPGCY